MKRLAFFCILVSCLVLATGLCQTALDPNDFSGQWYSSENQNLYVFQEGLIHCPKHAVEISADESISGAYSCSRTSIFLFAKGIQGLEKEKELYLVHNGKGSFLCENQDGTGKIYFARYHP